MYFRATIVAMLAIAGLSSCKTMKEVAARERQQDTEFCQSIGATGDKFADCMMYRDAQRNAEYAQNQQRVMDMYRASQASRPRMIQTTCTRSYGLNTVNCTSY
jgi:hypothetical protein